MIAVDTSAIVAVAKREPGYEGLLRALLAVDCLGADFLKSDIVSALNAP